MHSLSPSHCCLLLIPPFLAMCDIKRIYTCSKNISTKQYSFAYQLTSTNTPQDRPPGNRNDSPVVESST